MKFRIWLEDEDEGAARTVEASDVLSAVMDHVGDDYARRDGWEWSWPVTYVVEDPGGKRWTVEVEMEMEPTFGAGLPKEMP